MTEVRNLSELLARVEKATKREREVDAAIALAFGWRHVMEPYSGGDPIPCWYDHNNIEQFLPYFTSSLEAAVALVERVLPGVSYVQRHDPDQIKWDGRHYAANVGDMPHEGGNFWIAAPTPALALIAATLRALKVRAEAERIGSPSQEQKASEQNKNLPPEAVEP